MIVMKSLLLFFARIDGRNIFSENIFAFHYVYIFIIALHNVVTDLVGYGFRVILAK